MTVPYVPPRSASNDPPLAPAMLARFTNSKGKDVWVNPAHVRVVRAKGSITEVIIDPAYLILKIASPPEEVAAALDAAMPPVSFISDSPPPQM